MGGKGPQYGKGKSGAKNVSNALSATGNQNIKASLDREVGYSQIKQSDERSHLDDLSYGSGIRSRGGKKGSKASAPVVSVPPSISDSEYETDEWSPTPKSALKLILSARFAAALWTSISDCDETYNYWEPTHYLMYGKGFQTWEYSPTYALRSYTYILMHAVPAKLYEIILKPNPLLVFIFLRCFLAFVSTFTEYMLYKAVRNTCGGNVCRLSLMASLFSAGMFISSTAYLPSAFSGYMTALAIGAWLEHLDELAIFSIALSALLSWPFAALTGVFIALDILVVRRRWLLFFKWSILSFVIILVPIVAIDSSFYGKTVIAPLNIVMYNIFSNKGPELYGTESWSFYIINGFLNFNIMFIFTLLCPILLILTANVQDNFKQKMMVALTALLWFAVFIVQPHKEERFLFPIYPLIPVCGAIGVDSSQKIMEWVSGNILNRFVANVKQLQDYKRRYQQRILVTFGVVAFLACSVLGSSRILALHYGYRAPFELYFHLHRENLSGEPLFEQSNVTICYGKEWHRFPTSFLLPNPQWNVRFIESDFKGQLPGLYPELDPEGTRVVPKHMNDDNLEETSRYVNISTCDFLVDRVDVDSVSTREPNYASKTEEWKIVTEYPFLNPTKSHPFFRAFYIPFISAQHTTYDQYVFLMNEKKRVQLNVESSAKQKSRISANEFLDDF